MIDLHDERLIQALLKQCNPNKLESDLSRRLATVANIKQAMIRCEQLRREELGRHNTVMSQIETEMKRLRQDCGHQVVYPHELATTEDDSYTSCEICGAIL